MSNVNKYWKNYKLKFHKKWHFDTFSKKCDYQFIGNLKTNYKLIDKLVKSLDKNSAPEYAVEENPSISNKKVNEKIKSYTSWGYKKENTMFYRAFSSNHKKIFKKFINFTNLKFASSSIIKQPPGNTIPWHYDTHIKFYEQIKREKLNIKKKEIIRYMIFLEDWDWGHFFCVGSSVIPRWKKGDIITWDPMIHHTGSNGGMKPKVTMNVTGVITKQSIHLNNNQKKFFI